MTKNKAIQIYLNKQSHANTMILRLMKFDKKLSITNNAKMFKCSYDTMRLFMVNYGLKCKLDGSGNYVGNNGGHNYARKTV